MASYFTRPVVVTEVELGDFRRQRKGLADDNKAQHAGDKRRKAPGDQLNQLRCASLASRKE
jgi:hypothetical protein